MNQPVVRLPDFRTAATSARARILASAARLSLLVPLTYSVVPPAPRIVRPFAMRRGQSHARRDRRIPTDVKPIVRIIANPHSGTLQRPGVLDELDEALRCLNDAGMPAELRFTERPGHATELAAEAVRMGMEVVVAAGGDGTVNDVTQALAGHTTALGVLPLGTVNVWAREVGIPLHAVDACEVLVRGERRRVDLGRAGSRYFLLMAGIGFDAEVAKRVEQGSWLKRLGLKLLDYLATAARLGLTSKPARVWVRRNGKRRSLNALMIIIGNTRLYGGTLTFATRAVADDGLLDVVIVGGEGLLHRGLVLLRALLRRPSLGPSVRYERMRALRLESDRPLPVQVDGEVVGMLPMTFSVAPLALTVVVPRDAPEHLFQRPALPPRK